MDTVTIYNEYKAYLVSRGRSRSTFAALDYGFRGVLLSVCEENEEKSHQLDAIRPKHIDAFVAREISRGSKPQTVNPRMSILHRFFSWCLQRGYLTTSPMAAWEPLRKADTPPRRDFTRAEVEAVLRHEQDPVDLVRWTFYFNTGRRVGEGVMLRWEWVDLERRRIGIPADANKSGRFITIHINEVLYHALKKHKAKQGEAYTGYVFPHITGRSVLRRFKRALRNAGINPDLYCLHSARHTTAMELYQRSGHNLELVRKVLGHTSILTTQKYLHVDDEEAKLGMESLNYA